MLPQGDNSKRLGRRSSSITATASPEVPFVHLPPNHPPRERWLARAEVARLLRHCWRHQENQAGRMRYTRRHVARFILIAIYSGRRSSAITDAKLEPSKDSGWID